MTYTYSGITYFIILYLLLFYHHLYPPLWYLFVFPPNISKPIILKLEQYFFFLTENYLEKSAYIFLILKTEGMVWRSSR